MLSFAREWDSIKLYMLMEKETNILSSFSRMKIVNDPESQIITKKGHTAGRIVDKPIYRLIHFQSINSFNSIIQCNRPSNVS